MRRNAALATAALSVLLSLALGTSAVALREEPAAKATARPAATRDAPSLPVSPAPLGGLARATTTPGSARLVDDGRAPTAAPAPTPQAGAADTAPTAEPSQPPPPVGVPPAAVPAPDCAVLACVALTFDDGPGPDTNRLLDELAARGVHATFFVVGRQIAREPGVVGREAAEGHVVGNHSWDHAALPALSVDAVAAELDSTDQAIAAAGAPVPTLARPPYGSTSPGVADALRARGMAGVLWDVDTEDWKNRDAGVTTQRALEGVHAGAIILMHDIRPSTVDAVPGLVDALRSRGFTLVTVPQLLGGPEAGEMYAHR